MANDAVLCYYATNCLMHFWCLLGLAFAGVPGRTSGLAGTRRKINTHVNDSGLACRLDALLFHRLDSHSHLGGGKRPQEGFDQRRTTANGSSRGVGFLEQGPTCTLGGRSATGILHNCGAGSCMQNYFR
jgi:hypothetical protein